LLLDASVLEAALEQDQSGRVTSLEKFRCVRDYLTGQTLPVYDY
jgi:hypothetical protein